MLSNFQIFQLLGRCCAGISRISNCCCVFPQFSFTSKQTFRFASSNFQVFDRPLKRKQRDWAAQCKDYDVCQYVKDEVGYQIADKICDLNKFNEVCLDLGCGGGHIAKYVTKLCKELESRLTYYSLGHCICCRYVQEKVGVMLQCDMSEGLVHRSESVANSEVPILSVVADEELVPFKDQCVDLIVSSLSGHWINNLPKWFSRCFSILREDCAMIGAILAGDTLQELRISLQLAETERLGGVGAHVSPLLLPQDIGSLMSRTGFKMITLDSDRIEIGYPNMFALLYDLQSMGESKATKGQSSFLRKDVLIAADAIYREMFGSNNGAYPATFHVISFIGWKPGPLMPKPAKRGSQNVSFKDISKVLSGETPLPSSN